MIHDTREYLFLAENNQLDPNGIRFVPVNSFSPYMECLPTALNRISTEDGMIEVNPYYKYEKIFAALLNSFEAEEYRETRNFLFDFWIREAYRHERLEGLTRRAVEREELMQEILKGELGDKIQKRIALFDLAERDFIVDCMIALYEGGDEIHLFSKAVKRILANAWLYFLDKREILIYAGEKENYLLKKKLQSLQYIFLPIGMETEIFWERHFGVFGIEDAMRLDEVVMI